MRQGQTRVRLVYAAFGGTHGAVPGRAGRKPAGDTITILLPPQRPDDGWNCGTANVWRVGKDSLREIGLDGNYCVCEHQIEID